ncbi:MAG TPA: GntR family transcriptional regulator [Pseudonocardiaceae bacterium]|nr:GntR family transcriptional regulator [Pseudonocardiaceae bacterium]
MKSDRQGIRPPVASTSPTYLDIATWLRGRIETGELPPGDRVPTAHEVMSVFEVSERTARRALNELKDEHLTVARPGQRTVIRKIRPVVRVVSGRADLGRTFWPTDTDRKQKVKETGEFKVRAPADIAHVLQIPPGSPLRVRYYYHSAPHREIQFATSYRPSYVAGRAEPVAVRFRDELRVRVPTKIERDLMGLTILAPVMEIARTAYDANDRAIELIVMVMDANAYILEYGYLARK